MNNIDGKYEVMGNDGEPMQVMGIVKEGKGRGGEKEDE